MIQSDKIIRYLDDLDRTTHARGISLSCANLISNCDFEKLDEIEGFVQGTHRYAVTLTDCEDEVIGMCTCPVGVDCKHCAALAIYSIQAQSTDLGSGAVKGKLSNQNPTAPVPKKRPYLEEFYSEIERCCHRLPKAKAGFNNLTQHRSVK